MQAAAAAYPALRGNARAGAGSCFLLRWLPTGWCRRLQVGCGAVRQGAPNPPRPPGAAVEGWVLIVSGIHEEAQEEDLHEAFSEVGEML